MKSILISIKPKYVADILNGKKTIEIRKTMPKCDLPIDVYIYCTKDNKHFIYDISGEKPILKNGKVVAKFTLNNVKEWHSFSWHFGTCYGCVSDEELRNYSKGVKSLYYWFIDNLEIFDKPKELSEFKTVIEHKKPKDIGLNMWVAKTIKPLTKAPQSWCYVEKLL